MSNPGHTRPGGLRPQFTTLPDGRQRAVTFFKLASGEQVTTDLILPWGGLYSAIEKVNTTGKRAHLAGLRLVGGQEARQMQGGGDWVWVREYEELHATNETQVGKNRRRIGDDGRVEIVAEFIQLSSATRTPGTVAVSTPPAPDAAEAVMATEDPQDDGAVRRITRVYVAAGLLSTGKSIVGDDLVDVTWVSVRTRQEPTFGEIMRDDVQKPNGIPVYTVTKRQSSSGGAASSAGYSFTTKERFRAPGRLKAQKFTKTILSPGTIPDEFDFDTLLLYRASPVDFEDLSVVVTVSWTTTNTPGTISPAVWDPQQWAVVDWDLILTGPMPYRSVTDQPGYCVVADTPGSGMSVRELTSGLFAGDYDIAAGIGRLYGGENEHTLTVRGPEYPEGESRTLGPVRFEPGFTALDGTRWYKKVQRVATLPTLPALPNLEV